MLIYRKIKKKNTQIEIIGVLASSRGIGGTHLSIMLANYLASKKGKKVALVEMNASRQDFEKISNVYKMNKKNFSCCCFKLFGVDYYSSINKAFLGELYSYGYDYIILDMGNNYDENRDELLRCSKKIILGSMHEWKRSDFFEILEKISLNADYDEWKYLLLFGHKKDIRNLCRKYKISVVEMPQEADPFLIHSDNFDFFEELIMRK